MPEARTRITETLRGRKEQLLRAAYLTAVRGDAKITDHFARRLVESKGIVPAFNLQRQLGDNGERYIFDREAKSLTKRYQMTLGSRFLVARCANIRRIALSAGASRSCIRLSARSRCS